MSVVHFILPYSSSSSDIKMLLELEQSYGKIVIEFKCKYYDNLHCAKWKSSQIEVAMAMHLGFFLLDFHITWILYIQVYVVVCWIDISWLSGKYDSKWSKY